jgi:hypothetical protein
MRSFASPLLVLSLVVGCSGGTGEATNDPPVDTGVEAALLDTSVATDATDASDGGDGFATCKADGDCASSTDGKACDISTGKCVPCTSTSDLCTPSEHCDGNKCVTGCKSDDGCATAASDAGTDADGGETGTSSKTKCDVATHTCVDCAKDEHCAAGFLCVGNVCSAGCSTTKPCPTSESCCSGACVNTQSNTDHCGMCGGKCTTTTGTAKCETGACKVATCSGALKDCDGDFTNGCEVDTATTVAHCGGCGTTCAPANVTSAKCETGACGYVACATLYADCDSNTANGCERSTASDPANCGGCGIACPSRSNSTSSCAMGACAITCNTGYADCDGDPTNGCEIALGSDPGNCGTCGNTCTATNGTAVCSGGMCGLGSCNVGFGNCDSNAGNGCETNVSTSVSHCGACNAPCSIANASASCAAGMCGIASCNSGYANCDSDVTNGCEINTSTNVSHCGVCGNTCSLANASSGCSSGTCTVAACNTNFSNCDGNPANGCEINTQTDANHCGACNNVCPAGVLCNAGACLVPTSCQALRTAIPTAPSGRYRIDPDGSAGPTAAFDVYCEMIGSEGWTLALKANGRNLTFAYPSTHWTTNSTLNTTSTDLTATEAKFQSFNTMPFTQLRLGMREGTVDRFITVAAAGGSLLTRFSTLGYVATSAGRSEWIKLVGTPRLQPYCSREGTNNDASPYAQVRIGLLANQENDCGSPDSFIGFGAGSVACAGGTPLTVGNVGTCGSSPSDGTTATFGFVFLR